VPGTGTPQLSPFPFVLFDFFTPGEEVGGVSCCQSPQELGTSHPTVGILRWLDRVVLMVKILDPSQQFRETCRGGHSHPWGPILDPAGSIPRAEVGARPTNTEHIPPREGTGLVFCRLEAGENQSRLHEQPRAPRPTSPISGLAVESLTRAGAVAPRQLPRPLLHSTPRAGINVLLNQI